MKSPSLLRAIGPALLLLAACSAEKTGPTPKVDALTPALVCSEQLTTQVAVAGAELSPLAIDAATKDPRLAIPALSLRRTADLAGTPVEGTPVEIPNDPYSPEVARVKWTSPTSMSLEIFPELGLEPGLYEVTATNANGHTATLSAALTVVPRPTVETAEPDLVCLDQGLRSVVIRGTGFLKTGGLLPTVTIGELTVTADSLEDCATLPGPLAADSCATARITVPEDALPAGAFLVTVTNPAPAGCHSTDELPFAVVPRPALVTVEPDLQCLAEGERALRLTGSGFVTVDGHLPTVAFSAEKQMEAAAAEECTPIAGTRSGAQSCAVLTLSVPQAWLEPGAYQVVVTNPDPAGCYSEESVSLAIVPPPSISEMQPDLTCLEEDERAFTLTGNGFVVLRGETDQLPTVRIGETDFTPTAATECEPIAGTTLDAESCHSLALTLPTDSVPVGAAAIAVTNPMPAGCSSTETVEMAVVPEPMVASVQPDLFCSDNGTALTIEGSGFVKLGSTLPTVLFGPASLPVEIAASEATGCVAIEGTLSGAESCTGLSVTVPTSAVPAGTAAVAVRNPMPAGCTSNENVTAAVLGRPAIASIEPAAVCFDNQPTAMNVVGTGFLFGAATEPTLTVDGNAVQISARGGCAAVSGGGSGFEICTSLTFPVPVSGFSQGTHTVSLVNPEPADCAVAATVSFEVTSAPTLASVLPLKVCRTGGSIAAEGTGFVTGSQLVLMQDGATATLPTTYVSDTQLTGEVSGYEAGDYEVAVSNGAGCESPETQPLRIVEQPFVFFVDPPVVYNGIDLQVTIYASGISDTVTAVNIQPSGTTDPPTALTFTYDPLRPNRILAAVPHGLPAGDYDILIQDAVCAASFPEGLHVTDTLSVSVAAIDAPFGWTSSRTPVDITSLATPPQGFVNFAATPRAYLNPKTGGFATELRAVAFLDPLRLSGVVPSMLAVGTYDLVVINPDGGVGLLADAYKVVADPPPEVSALSPASVPKATGQQVAVIGESFRDGADASATCTTPTGAILTPPDVTTFGDANHLSVLWDMSAVDSGSVCIVRVSNTDGTYTDFSALMVTTPSGNPNPFELSQPMTSPRRSLAAAAVRMNSLERYLFAIGGDDGNAPTVYDSVEAARVDALGNVGTWAAQRNALPAPRNFVSAAVVGRYVYAPGGQLADTTATDEVLRAYLLDPFEAPELTDIDLTMNPDLTSGMQEGTWYYRVAAVLDANDPNNPLGEALASEPLVVRLPSGGKAIELKIYWTAVPNAASYRIYRSPTPNLTSGSELLLAEVPATGERSFVDDGSLTVGTEVPMPVGSLGKWHSVGTMQSARAGAAVVAVTNPTNTSQAFLYVLGGRSDPTTALAGYEYATVTSNGSNSQTVSAFTLGTSTMATARWLLGGVYIDAGRATDLQGTNDVYVYALPGASAVGGRVGQVDAFAVNLADGALGSRISVSAPSWSGGYGYAAGSNYLYVFGGSDGPSATGKSAAICRPGTPGCSAGAPYLTNWNAGISMNRDRYLHASAAESGFVFLLGGKTDTEDATTSTESTNF